MKIIVTIFQCKRVAYPYYFIKYCVPKMRELSGFEIEVYLIQHLTPVNQPWFETTVNKNGLDLVKKWTNEGKYEGAHIIQHSEIYEPSPAFPSYKKGVEIFLASDADYHIWLEDDAMIMDYHMKQWPKILKDKDAGEYQLGENYIQVRNTVTTKTFDKRMIKIMNEEKWEHKAWIDEKGKFTPLYGHIEYFMLQCCKTERIDLGGLTGEVSSCHMNKIYNVNLVKKIIPLEEVNFLNIDFPEAVYL